MASRLALWPHRSPSQTHMQPEVKRLGADDASTWSNLLVAQHTAGGRLRRRLIFDILQRSSLHMRLSSSIIPASLFTVCVAWASWQFNGGARPSAPPGFSPLFDGQSLAGWKGLVEPPVRTKLNAIELSA